MNERPKCLVFVLYAGLGPILEQKMLLLYFS